MATKLLELIDLYGYIFFVDFYWLLIQGAVLWLVPVPQGPHELEGP